MGRLIAIIMLLQLPGLAGSQTIVPPNDLAASTDAKTLVSVTINNRNGGPILGKVILQIEALKSDPQFAPYFTALVPDDAQANCMLTARKDKSGHFFDVARCMEVWPKAGKAPLLKSLETALAGPVAQKGAAALPPVKVVPYVYSQLVRQQEFRAFKGAVFFRDSNDELKPTSRFLRVLCDPTKTLITLAECEAKVKIVDRLVYEPDIFVGQTGYKVEVQGSMPRTVAVAFRQAILNGVHLTPGTRGDALRVNLISDEAVSAQQLVSELAPANLTAPVTLPSAPLSAASSADRLTELWATLNTSPETVDLTPDTDGTAPALLLFDSIGNDSAQSLTDWVNLLNVDRTKISQTPCPAGTSTTFHTDAVASLLMPAGIKALLSAQAPNLPAVALPSFPSFILTPGHFSGETVKDNYTWFDREALDLDAGAPVIALAVYDAGVKKTNSVPAKQALEFYLENPSNILVISAANWPGTPPAPRFPPSKPTDDAAAISFSCETMPWPSCLGVHPRVLVVGPTSAPSQLPRATFSADKYVLGAAVRVGAPSSAIPALSRCIGSADIAWGTAPYDGTSFGAPLVALLLAKIIQLDPQVGALPEAAIWRVQATANLIGAGDGSVDFGEIDAGRALRGASASDAGNWGAAAIYREGAAKDSPEYRVVMPYPWNDVPKNLEMPRGPTGTIGLNSQRRSAITVTYFDADGQRPKMLSLSFSDILRIVKRPEEVPGLGRLFDVYYLNQDRLKLRYVEVLRRARFGPSNLSVANPGFCRADDLPQEAETASSDIQPSCLYSWDPHQVSFQPLDLGTVEDIVLPTTHYRAKLIKAISPTDFASVAAKSSPWSVEFCRIGLRNGVALELKKKGISLDRSALCKAVTSGVSQ